MARHIEEAAPWKSNISGPSLTGLVEPGAPFRLNELKIPRFRRALNGLLVITEETMTSLQSVGFHLPEKSFNFDEFNGSWIDHASTIAYQDGVSAFVALQNPHVPHAPGEIGMTAITIKVLYERGFLIDCSVGVLSHSDILTPHHSASARVFYKMSDHTVEYDLRNLRLFAHIRGSDQPVIMKPEKLDPEIVHRMEVSVEKFSRAVTSLVPSRPLRRSY